MRRMLHNHIYRFEQDTRVSFIVFTSCVVKLKKGNYGYCFWTFYYLNYRRLNWMMCHYLPLFIARSVYEFTCELYERKNQIMWKILDEISLQTSIRINIFPAMEWRLVLKSKKKQKNRRKMMTNISRTTRTNWKRFARLSNWWLLNVTVSFVYSSHFSTHFGLTYTHTYVLNHFHNLFFLEPNIPSLHSLYPFLLHNCRKTI